MGALSPAHWLIIVGVVVLLFGAKKLPDFARSMGQSMRILKAETSELRDRDTTDAPSDPTPSITASTNATGPVTGAGVPAQVPTDTAEIPPAPH